MMAWLRVALLCGTALLIACGGSSASAPGAESTPAATPTATAPSADGTTDESAVDIANKCEHLSTKLCADIGPTTESCALVRERVPELSESRCGMMLRYYDEVLADLMRQEGRNQPLPPAQIAQLLKGAVATSGPDNAAVTIVLFSDFQCPFCAGAANATHDIRQRYGDKVRLVFRQFPLPFHEHAHIAAEASLAAQAQGKFWPMHDLLFANQGSLDRASLSRLAREAGLDVAAFDRALDGQTYKAAVDADLALGMDIGVDATPTMFMNGRRVPNPSDVTDISTRIDAALATP